MISCTEFVLAYSELFTYLDKTYGRPEVDKLWDFLFKPTGKGIPLINYAKKDGLKGCVDYWTSTLTEEAAEITRIYNLEAGWSTGTMHYCPSKGRLLEYKEKLGIEPYYDYCDHCDYYRAALEEVGITWIRNHINTDKASCSSIIWEKKKFKGVMKMDENTVVHEIHASEHEYFHPDFHSSMNMGIEYVGKYHGEDDVKAYFAQFTRNAYRNILQQMKEDPFKALTEKIQETYTMEKAPDAVTLEQTDNKLTVRVAYCPAVKHLKKTGRDISQWFYMSTSVVMETLAADSGLGFEMEHYDPETGAAVYHFTR